MGLVSKPFVFSAGAVIIASQHNSNFDTLYNLVNGTLDGTNLASNAAIADTQLAQITTAGKVAGAAITLASTTIVTAVGSDYALIGDTSDSGNPKKALVSDFSYTPTAANALSGSLLQSLTTNNVAHTQLTTLIPFDDSIPQIGEGTQIFSQAITPHNASNILEIECVVMGDNGANDFCVALFQDATAGALACALSYNQSGSGNPQCCVLCYRMAAGTTSSTTFTIRAGSSTVTTCYINGQNGNRKYGGVLNTYLSVKEIKA